MPATYSAHGHLEMSKADEIQLYTDFVEGLPRGSYLAAILKDSAATVAQQIRNDFSLPLAGELQASQLAAMEADDARRETEKKLHAAKQTLRETESRLEYLTREIAKIRDAAKKIAY